MKGKRTWIVVSDGAHARVFLNDGIGHGLALVPDATFDRANKPSQRDSSDGRGMTFDRSGDGRRRMQPKSDPHQSEEAAFVKNLSDYLEKQYARDRFDRLVLIAAPAALSISVSMAASIVT